MFSIFCESFSGRMKGGRKRKKSISRVFSLHLSPSQSRRSDSVESKRMVTEGEETLHSSYRIIFQRKLSLRYEVEKHEKSMEANPWKFLISPKMKFHTIRGALLIPREVVTNLLELVLCFRSGYDIREIALPGRITVTRRDTGYCT